MRDKFTVTISNEKGIHQYTYKQIVKIVIKWLVLVLLLLGLVGWGIYKIFPNTQKIDCKKDITHLKVANTKLKKQNQLLETQNKKLQLSINEKDKVYTQTDEELKKLEKFLAIDKNENSTVAYRIDKIRDIVKSKLQKSKKAIVVKVETPKINNQLPKKYKKVSKSLIAVLNQKIPNGEPVKKYKVISPYGYRIHPITKHMEFHPGIDMAVPVGRAVYATADGVIEYAKDKGAYGKYLLINHNYGFKTVYAHLSDFACTKGKYVKKGDIIAYSGNSGKSIQPHLHYEIRYLNKWLNPEPFLQTSPNSLQVLQKRNNMVNWTGIINQIKKD